MGFRKRIFKIYLAFSFCFLAVFLFIDNLPGNFPDYEIRDFNFEIKNGASSFSAINGQKININTATEEELSAHLKGIGKSKARSIIDYREKMGGFYSIDEIMNVNGIGKSIFQNIKDFICV